MDNERKYLLYKHISLSGFVYVGITSLSPIIRWGGNGCKYMNHPDYPFARAIKKYGWDSFSHIIIFDSISKQKAHKYEQHLISFYKMMGISYNITDGGESGFGNKSHLGMKASIETRKRMSKSGLDVVYQYSKQGEFIKKWNGQKTAGEELGINKRSISSACCGRIPSAGGYYWSKLPPSKWSMPKNCRCESGRKKCVYQYTLDGILVKKWNSVTEVKKECGYCIATIALACNYDGRAYNYLWFYNPISVR